MTSKYPEGFLVHQFFKGHFLNLHSGQFPSGMCLAALCFPCPALRIHEVKLSPDFPESQSKTQGLANRKSNLPWFQMSKVFLSIMAFDVQV